MVKHLLLASGISLALLNQATAQDNPDAQNLPYSFTSMTGNTLPAGMAVHRFGTSSGSIPTTRTTNNGNADLPAASSSTSGGYRGEGANGISMLASGSQAAGAVVVGINTTGKTNIQVSWVAGTILQQSARDNSIALQYRTDTNSATWTNVGTASTYTSQSKTNGDVSAPFTETLPADAENKSYVQVRWIYWESNSAGGGSRDRLSVDEISITGTAALPIQLSSFSAVRQQNTALIQWRLEESLQLSTQVLQKSKDGIHYTDLAAVPLKGNHEQYLVTDNNIEGRNYYRLKLTSLNGVPDYSQVVFISTDAAASLRVFPNPTAGNVQVQWTTEGPAALELRNMTGQVVAAQTISDRRETLFSTAGLPAGQYLLTWKQGDEVHQEKLLVRH